ncbi:MAG: hypothetical protein ACI8UD_000015 [Planctomycetota bacterium]|jgi:hypothetical protein
MLAVASLSAQKSVPPALTINESSLMNGGTASINYANAAMANQIVMIDIDNGMRRSTLTAVIEIVLDANGMGTATWQVPAWMGANFNAPGVTEVHRVII